MSIDPEIKVLPVYQILIGLVRLIAFFFLMISVTTAVSTLIDAALASGFDLGEMLDVVSDTYFWGQVISFSMIAVLIWCCARPVALVCTPKINLRYCQVCGYNLNGDTEKPCPECGKVPQTSARGGPDDSDAS
tara:strand:- start:130571 stop:130969 length:399 start_codon:yes stop_codon:yes gene_type:complete